MVRVVLAAVVVVASVLLGAGVARAESSNRLESSKLFPSFLSRQSKAAISGGGTSLTLA